MISYIIGLFGVVISFWGWFEHRSVVALVIGTFFYIVESFLERNNLNNNAKTMDIIIFLIGCVVGVLQKRAFFVCGMLAINFWSAIMTILGLPMIISCITKLRKRGRK